jgi:hypothetical protein
VLQLTRSGAVRYDTDLASLRDVFSRQHCITLPALIEPHLLKRIHAEVERGEFRELAHGSIASELHLQPGVCTGLLQFLVNDARLYALVEDLSGCPRIQSFAGRVYRRYPDSGHHDSWHGDLYGGREIGMSVNLSTDVYEGGVFEIRNTESERTLASIANVGFGDAIFFRVSPALEHRVTDVRGARPKTAFAGWFRTKFDYLAALRRSPFTPDAT